MTLFTHVLPWKFKKSMCPHWVVPLRCFQRDLEQENDASFSFSLYLYLLTLYLQFSPILHLLYFLLLSHFVRCCAQHRSFFDRSLVRRLIEDRRYHKVVNCDVNPCVTIKPVLIFQFYFWTIHPVLTRHFLAFVLYQICNNVIDPAIFSLLSSCPLVRLSCCVWHYQICTNFVCFCRTSFPTPRVCQEMGCDFCDFCGCGAITETTTNWIVFIFIS